MSTHNRGKYRVVTGQEIPRGVDRFHWGTIVKGSRKEFKIEVVVTG